MSLIGFHRVLIASAIVFCAGFALHQAQAYRATGSDGAVVTATAFALAAVGLSLYLRRLRRILGLAERERPRAHALTVPSGNGLVRAREGDSPTERLDEVTSQAGDGHGQAED
jgi:hypothetical protein